MPLILGGTPTGAAPHRRDGDGWFSSGNPSFDEARRLRARLGELCDEVGRERPLPIHVRMAGRDRDALARYGEQGFEHVTVWAQQVWPSDGDVASKEGRFAAAAADLLATWTARRCGRANRAGHLGADRPDPARAVPRSGTARALIDVSRGGRAWPCCRATRPAGVSGGRSPSSSAMYG